jgi:ATP-binding cassette subfamily C protein LapB
MGLAGRWQQSKTALKTLTELMGRPVEREETKSYVPLPRPKGVLQIKNVAFSYPQAGRKSLDGLTLDVAAGQKIALIGRVGSGKSTLLRLAAGFYWGESGLVSLDGIDLRQIDPAVLRQTVGLMAQDSRLFNGTLRENLTMGNTAVSDTRIVAVLDSLGLMSWVNEMASGLDSKIGEGGSGLSGGQRQLISMARLMLSNPTVVLLDEPTSALDTETEQRVIAALKVWLGNKTLLLATHRPSLLSLVDAVAVVNKGKIHSLSSKDALAEKLSQRA